MNTTARRLDAMKRWTGFSTRALMLTGLLILALALGACGADTGADTGTIDVQEDAVATEVVDAEEEPADAEVDVEEDESTESETTTETDTDVETEVITETDTIDVITTSEVTTETDVMTETTVITDTNVTVEGEEDIATDTMTDTEDVEEADFPDRAITGVGDAQGALVRGLTLLDYDFDNRDGEVSGDLEDLLVDLSTGDILFASIEYGGFLDLGDKDIIVPLSAFVWSPDGRLVLNFDEQALEAFPDVGNDWPDITNAGWDDDVNIFWRDIDVDPGFDFDETNASGVMWLSDMTGYSMADLGAGVGTIDDVLVDLGDSRVKYVLVGYGAAAAAGDSTIVPFSAIDIQDFETGELTFAEAVDLGTLDAAPRFSGARFLEGSDALSEDFDIEVQEYWEGEGVAVD